MSANRGGALRELLPLYPAAAAVLALSIVADSVFVIGISAGLSVGILLLLGYWWACRPVDQRGGR